MFNLMFTLSGFKLDHFSIKHQKSLSSFAVKIWHKNKKFFEVENKQLYPCVG